MRLRIWPAGRDCGAGGAQEPAGALLGGCFRLSLLLFPEQGQVRCLVLFFPLCFPKSCWNFEQGSCLGQRQTGGSSGGRRTFSQVCWAVAGRGKAAGDRAPAFASFPRAQSPVLTPPQPAESHHLRPRRAEACSHRLGVYYGAWHTGVQSKSLSLGLSRLSCAIFPGRPALSSTHFTEEKTEP